MKKRRRIVDLSQAAVVPNFAEEDPKLKPWASRDREVRKTVSSSFLEEEPPLAGYGIVGKAWASVIKQLATIQGMHVTLSTLKACSNKS